MVVAGDLLIQELAVAKGLMDLRSIGSSSLPLKKMGILYLRTSIVLPPEHPSGVQTDWCLCYCQPQSVAEQSYRGFVASTTPYYIVVYCELRSSCAVAESPLGKEERTWRSYDRCCAPWL